MLSLSRIVLRAAVAMLPESYRERFFQEWHAEIDALRRDSGDRAAFGFALGLLSVAPKMTMALRADSQSGYAELSIGLLFSIFPSAVLVGLALYTQVWIMVVGELAIIAGILLMSSSFWTGEGRLFDSTRSRVGIVLAAIGSGIEVAVRRVTGFGPPIDEVVSATIPHGVIMLGLILWVVSSYAGKYRFRVLLVSVCVIAPGALLNTIVAGINGAALSGFDRFGVLMYVVPSAALAWSCYAVVGRRQVFAESVLEVA